MRVTYDRFNPREADVAQPWVGYRQPKLEGPPRSEPDPQKWPEFLREALWRQWELFIS